MLQWDEIERQALRASDVTELRGLRDNIHEAFDAARFAEGAVTVDVVNRLHDALIRTTLAMTEKRVRTSYPGVPPVSSFVVVLFGSGGRKEQTLWSDQDNGLVYEVAPGADLVAAERYMAELGAAFQSDLEAVGYPPCEGKVLVSNPAWRKSLDGWRATLSEWFERPAFETVRHLLILADARPIYGDVRLAEALRGELFARVAAERETMLPRMLQNTLRYKVLVGVLGNLLTERYGEDAGGIDLKYGAYLPMVNAIRLLSLGEGAEATSTLERISALELSGRVSPESARRWSEAFRTILKLRTMTPYRLEDGIYTTKGILAAKTLTKEVKRELKDALRVGASLQRLLKRTFGTEGHL